MKKLMASIAFIICFSGCFVFQKKVKYGCPGSPQPGELTTDQKISAGENVKQPKYKGGRKSF